MKPQATSGLALVLWGLAFGGLCAFAIKTDITKNLEYFGQIDAGFASVTVAAAICIAVLPWKRWGVLKAVCLALTCWAAAAAYANSLGLDIARNADAGKTHAAAISDAMAARATLTRITETSDTSTLETMAAVAKAKAAAEDAKARDRLGNEDASCAKVRSCREAGGEYSAMLGRLAQAKARDTAQAAISKADAKADAVGTAKVDVMATKLASILGTGYEDTAQTIAVILAILAIGATQGAALLGHSALGLIGEGIGMMLAARRDAQPVQKVERPVKAERKTKPHKLTKGEALALLRAHIDQYGGEMLASGQQIAKLFPGVHRNTVCGARGWLAQWRRDGELEAVDHGSGATCWRAAKAAA